MNYINLIKEGRGCLIISIEGRAPLVREEEVRLDRLLVPLHLLAPMIAGLVHPSALVAGYQDHLQVHHLHKYPGRVYGL